MAEFISLVTSIAACLSAVAAFVVVRQNYKQRTASYRPDFVLVRTPIQSKIFETPDGIPYWSNDGTNDAANKRFSIPLVNVGLGAAREIKVVWNFPIHEFVSSVNRLAQASLTPVYFEYEITFYHSKNQTIDGPSYGTVNHISISFCLRLPIKLILI